MKQFPEKRKKVEYFTHLVNQIRMTLSITDHIKFKIEDDKFFILIVWPYHFSRLLLW